MSTERNQVPRNLDVVPAGPPSPGPDRNVDYPEVPETRLSNGLTVALIRDDRLPRVHFRLGLPIGRIDNPSSNHGLSQFAMELLFEGTTTRSSRQIAEELDQHAVQSRSELLMEHSWLSMSSLASSKEKALELLADVVLNATFPEQELEKLRKRWRSYLLSLQSQPSYLANQQIFRLFFGDHPYSRLGLRSEDLEDLTQSSVHRFWQQTSRPSLAQLVVSGPLDLSGAVELAERYFGGWTESGSQRPVLAPPPRVVRSQRLTLVDRPNSVQSRMVVGGIAPARTGSGMASFRVANQIFGGGGSSRLFMNLREDKGYTYGAYSSVRAYREAGRYLASADLHPEATVPAIRETQLELEGIATRPPSADEMERSKQEISGSFLRQIETSPAVASLEVSRRMSGLPESYYREFVSRTLDVREQHVISAAREYFNPSETSIVVVGDRKQLESDLRGIRPLDIVDAEGELLHSD